MLSHTAGTPTIIDGRKALTFPLQFSTEASVRVSGEVVWILDESLTTWHAEKFHYQLHEEAIFVSEMMAKEDINRANGWDEVGIYLRSVGRISAFVNICWQNWVRKTFSPKQRPQDHDVNSLSLEIAQRRIRLSHGSLQRITPLALDFFT
jgi:hypothetical protein